MTHVVESVKPAPSSATCNTCRLCAPLGACLAFRGVEGAMPLLHGSQGCATYIRRYMISHFREPLDIASSNFSEETAVFGGGRNLRTALENVVRQYDPQLVGVATTCLAETIGDDVTRYLREIRAEVAGELPPVVHVSTPSYAAGHEEGYHAAVSAIVAALATDGPHHGGINVIAPMASPADLRYLKSIVLEFGLEPIFMPDYSDSLDGPVWSEYQRIPPGGTPVDSIRRMGGARATIEFGCAAPADSSAGALLETRFGVPRRRIPLPVGVARTDQLMDLLADLAGRPLMAAQEQERGRLLDSYVDAHKYVFGKRAVVYGEQDLVVGIAALLAEVGAVPALCGSGSNAGRLREALVSIGADRLGNAVVLEDTDFARFEVHAERVQPDMIIGGSKGYSLSRRLKVPLVRVGFPIHDRIDGPRLLHLGYRGAQQLFDRVVNALVEASQDSSPVGYSYM